MIPKVIRHFPMLRKCFYAVMMLLACSSLGRPQSSADGRVVNGTYQNSFFHFSYLWPSFLQPFDLNALVFPKATTTSNEFLLFSAREGGEPFGIVMVAERMNVPTQHSGGLKSGSDMIDRIAHFSPEQHVTVQPRKHFINADGVVFDELDYTEDGVPSSAVVFQMNDFLIVAKCNAKSPFDLEQMNKSIAGIRKIK